MKHLLYIFCLLYITAANAQNCIIPTNELGKFEVSKVVEVGDFSKEEISNAALLSVADFVKDPNNITKFRDIEAGIFISEIEVMHQTAFGVGNFFYFNLKMEIKEGRYRFTANYLDCLLMVTPDSTCKCNNDLAEKVCQVTGCILLPNRWDSLRCKATEELRFILEDYMKTIDANLAKSDW